MYKREKPIEKVVIKSKIIKNRIKRKVAQIKKEKSENRYKRMQEIKEKKKQKIEDNKMIELEKRKFKSNVHVGEQLWEWLKI